MTCKPNHDSKTSASDAAYAATDAPTEVPFVSAVIGVGDDAHRMVHVGAWGFTAWGADGQVEPRIRDIDLGIRLGYERPRTIRDLIERMIAAGKLNDIHVRRTVQRTQMPPPGGVRETVVEEYWLTEAQALKVAARAETDVADALLDEMIRVYMLAKQGLLPQQSAGVSQLDVAAIVNEALRPVLALVERLTSAPRTLAHSPGIGLKVAKQEALGPLKEMAAWEAAAIGKRGDAKVLKRLRAKHEKALRRELGFPADKGAGWAVFPLGRLAEARNVVARMLGTATSLAELGGVTTLDAPDPLFNGIGAK